MHLSDMTIFWLTESPKQIYFYVTYLFMSCLTYLFFSFVWQRNVFFLGVASNLSQKTSSRWWAKNRPLFLGKQSSSKRVTAQPFYKHILSYCVFLSPTIPVHKFHVIVKSVCKISLWTNKAMFELGKCGGTSESSNFLLPHKHTHILFAFLYSYNLKIDPHTFN